MNLWLLGPIQLSPWLSYMFNHLWQSTLVVALVWLFTLTLLRNNRPHVRYAMWLAASVKFVIPFAAIVKLGSRLGFMHLATPSTQVQLYFAMDEANRRPIPFRVSTALAPTTPAPQFHMSDLFIAIWACGVLFVIGRWLLAWMRVRGAVRRATLLRTYEGLRVLSSSALRERGLEPGVFGLFRPVVLVPDGIQDRLSTEQFDAVLAHEARHATRRDNLAAAAHMVVEALFWFYPLVWWLGRRLVEERERACDEDVTRVQQPEIYAEGILNVCKFYLESPLDCVSGITGAELKQRIADIMMCRKGARLNWLRRVVLATSGVAAVAGPLFLGILQTPASRAQVSNFDGKMYTVAEKQFEVATAKENVSGSSGWRLGPPQHGSVSIVNLQMRRIIASSFRVQDKMVFGPAWLDSMRYDIVGKGPDPNVANPEVWEMMRSLLRDTFKLRYHVEKREIPVFALTVAKGGARLKDPKDGPCAEAIHEGRSCGDIIFPPYGAGIINAQIGAFIGGLARVIQDRPVVDRTGLTGKYDATVRWMPDNMKPEDLAKIPEKDRPEDVPLPTALEQQLGLKLEARKEAIDVVVVDSIEKPAETSAGAGLTAFDAVSIRPNKSAMGEVRLDAPSGPNFIAQNVSLRMLVMRAFKVKNYAVEGGPSWMDSDRFDIAAHADQPNIPEPDFKLMLQSMVADRFQLKLHRETKQVAVYNLAPLRAGSKLPEAKDSCVPRDQIAQQPPPPPGAPAPVICGGFIMDGSHLEGRRIAAPLLANALSEMLGRPVVDQTGYSGAFDVHLEFSPEGIATLTGGGFEKPILPANSTGDSRPSIFSAIQQQLGLRLESGHGPSEVLVIDSAARPAAN